MTDNLDELKKQWQSLSTRVDNLAETNRRLSERLAKSNVTSLQESLASRIRRCAGIGLVMPLLAPMLYSTIGLPWPICVAYALFGLMMAWLSFRFARFINSERLIDLPVSDAIMRASEIKSRQEHIRLLGMVCAALLIASVFYALPDKDNTWVMAGFAAGLVIGLAIGIPRAVANHRIARKLVDSLKENS